MFENVFNEGIVFFLFLILFFSDLFLNFILKIDFEIIF